MMKPGSLALLAGLGLALALAAYDIGLDPGQIIEGAPNMVVILREMLAIDPGLIPEAVASVIETIEMAALGTAIGFILALPLSLLAARNLATAPVSMAVRWVLSVIRTIPSLLWAIIFVVVVGLGPRAGVLAITMYSLGFLGKLFYELFESQNPGAYEYLRTIGASRIHAIRYVTIPEAAPYMLSHLLFMFEYNVRASTVLGFVGAGGVGFYILNYIQVIEYGRAFTFILVVLVFVLAIDYISLRVRERFTPRLTKK